MDYPKNDGDNTALEALAREVDKLAELVYSVEESTELLNHIMYGRAPERREQRDVDTDGGIVIYTLRRINELCDVAQRTLYLLGTMRTMPAVGSDPEPQEAPIPRSCETCRWHRPDDPEGECAMFWEENAGRCRRSGFSSYEPKGDV